MALPSGFEIIKSPFDEKESNLPAGFELIDNPFKLPPQPPEQEPYTIGSGILDLLKQTVSPAVSGLLKAPQGAELAAKGLARQSLEGSPSAVMPASVYSPGLDTEETLFGPETDAQKARRSLGAQRVVAAMPSIPGAKYLSEVGDKVQKSIYDSLSNRGKQALEESKITGNIFKGEVDFGDNPTTMGYALQVANVFGSMAPVLATAILTRSPTAGGFVGGSMASSEAGQSAAEEFGKLSDKQLLEQSPFYAQMIAGGSSPKEARELTIKKAAESGAVLQGLVATFGDRFTGSLVTGAFNNILKKAAKTATGRTVAGGAVSAAEQAAQETAEGVASDIGIASVLPTKEIGEDSAANLILGALGGVGPGAVSGVRIKETPQEQRARLFADLMNESVKDTDPNKQGVDKQAINAMRPDRGFQKGTNLKIDPATGEATFGVDPSPQPTSPAPAGIAAPTEPIAPIVLPGQEGIASLAPPINRSPEVDSEEGQDLQALLDEANAILDSSNRFRDQQNKPGEASAAPGQPPQPTISPEIVETQKRIKFLENELVDYELVGLRPQDNPRVQAIADELNLLKSQPIIQGVPSGNEAPQAQQTETQGQQAPTATVNPLRPRVDAVIQQLKDAGLDESARMVENGASRRFNEDNVKFWEEYGPRMIAENNLIRGAEKGTNPPVAPVYRTLADLYEGKYENQSGLAISPEVTDSVLQKSNAYIKQAADLGINLRDIDSRFPQALQDLKREESQLRGQFVRYANTRKRVEREYKNATVDGFLAAEQELGSMIGEDLKTKREQSPNNFLKVTPAAPVVTPANQETTPPVPAAAPSATPANTKVAPAIAPKTAEDVAKVDKATDDLMDALGELGDLLTKNTRMNIVPEDEQKLMPILSKLMDAAFRLGYYKFKQAAQFILKTIREKLGRNVEQQITLDHLQGAYISMAGKYQGTSSKKEVVSVESLQELGEDSAQDEQPTAQADLSTPDGKFVVAQQIAGLLTSGRAFDNIVEARQEIARMTGQKIEAGTESAKQADEAIEVGVVLASRAAVEQGRKDGLSSGQIYDKLVDLYKRQPGLNVRSSTSVANQAYSTPNALAFLASERAGINKGTSVYEPTAGNGMLLIGANPSKVTANELNADRFQMLTRVLKGGTVTEGNALQNEVANNSFDVVIENPPFGKVGDISNIDHDIALASLQGLKEDGRAVLILGGVQATTEDGRRDGYRGNAKRNFYYELYNMYNVVDHFTVGGNLYAKQGTTYPVDVIVIDGWGKSKRDLPASDLPQLFTSYEQLKEKLNDRMVSSGDVGATGTDVGVSTEGGAEPGAVGGGTKRQGDADGTEGGKPSGGSKPNVQEDGSTGGGQRKSAGELTGEGKPKPADVSKRGTDEGAVSSEGGRGKPGSEVSNKADKPTGVGGVSIVSGERVESGLKARVGEEEETSSQVTYTPKSGATAVGTLAPRAMAQSIQDSIDRIESQVGNVDDFVAESLEMDPETLREKFSGEQIDALVLAIRNAQEGKGFIIGDQTGVGKGRVVAAMIKYALISGKIPIFVTEKPNLYSDMIRDLDDIGMTDELGLDTAKPKIFITNGSESIPYTLLRKVDGEMTENNLTLKAPKSGAKLDEMMRDMQEKEDLDGFKVIFTTYSQLQTVKGKTTERQRFIKQFGAANYMIFDESHNAGGAGETQARTKEQRDKEKEGKGLAQGRAAFVRELVQNAYGTFFSSATYAKRPDVMDLYSSTDMKLAVDKLADLADAIKNGGIPMQQTVATMLAKVGQYIRRERTFAGVSYDTKETKVDKETAENMASSMRMILAFSRAKESVVKEMQKEFDKQGARTLDGGEKTQVQSANFGSIMHNLIDQMLLSLKAQDSVSHAIDRLKAGEKVVMTVSNTMGSFLQSYAEEMGLATGDVVDLSFADLYQRYLEKQRVIKIKRPSGALEEYRLTDQDLGQALTSQFNEIKGFINNSGFGSAPISPIDHLHSELNKAGYKTEEITGRTLTLNYSSGKPLLTSRSANIKQRVTAVKNFNNGTADVIILNQAGSTGLSLHASSKFKDQRKRHMVIVQPEKNIDTHMQMLGRVHRTGQVIPPAYSQMMADIPAEMRPAAVLLKKMASLNANTTGSRKSAVAAEGAVDFMNDYGGQVAQEYLRDNPEVYEDIGGKRIVELVDDPAEATENDIRRLTGYIPILPIKQQEEVYKDLIERYNELLTREDSMGTNKLESKAADLDAKIISSEPITEDKGTQSDFGKPAYMEKVDVKRTVKPFSKDEVKEQVKDNLGGKTPSEFGKGLLQGLSERVSKYIDERVAVIVDDDIKANTINGQISAQASHVRSVIEAFPIGSGISIKNTNGVFIYGAVANITNNKKTKNPVAGSDWKMQIALANGDAKTITLSFSQIGSTYTLKQESEINWLNPETTKGEYIQLMDLFDKGATVRREKRWMVTGNILAGFAAVDNMGQIMSYTKDDGTTGQGILMPRTFDFEKSKKDAPVKLKSVNDVTTFLDQFNNGTVSTEDSNLRIVRRGGSYTFATESSKKLGGQYFLDKGLTDIIGDFYKKGSVMSVTYVSPNQLDRAVQYLLADKGVTLIAANNKEEARKLFAPKPFTPPMANINEGPIGQRLNLDENRFMDREETILLYQRVRQKRANILSKFAKGTAGLSEQQALTNLDETADELSNLIKATKPERRSAKNFFADATKAWDAGEISDDVYSAIQTMYQRHPKVLEGLRFSVRMNAANPNASGEFFALPRIVRLYKGTVGTEDPVTIRHELVHSLEQMMDPEAAEDLIKDWRAKLSQAMKTDKSPKAQAYFRAILEFFENPTEDTFKLAVGALPNYSYYQYLNPSEYWAVNAEKLMARKLGSGWDRFVLSARGMLEALKDMFGFDNQRAVHKAFNQVMSGKMDRNTNKVLNDYVAQQSFSLMNVNVRRNYKGGPAPLATWQSANESKIDDFIYRIQDKHVDTKRVVEAIKNEVGRIEDAWDPYLQEELFHGRTAKQTTDFLTKELRPFLERMTKMGVSLQDFEEYLHNRHAEARNVFIAARNPEMQDGGSEIFTQDARKYMQSLSKETKDKYEDLAKTIDGFVKDTQDLLVSSGLDKQETIDGWRKNLPFYVPLNRDPDELDYVSTSSGMGQGFGVGGSSGKLATGSLKTVVDIVGNIALARERAIVRSEKARVGRALYALAIQNPNPNFWMPINPSAFKNKRKLAAEMISMGMTPADAENIVQEPKTGRLDKTTGQIKYEVNPALRNSPNVLSVRINGEDRFVFFNPGNPSAKRMVESLKNLDVQQMDQALGNVAEATRLLAALSTQYNPVFGAFNFVRDIGSAAINLSSTPIADRKLQVVRDATKKGGLVPRTIFRAINGKGATSPEMKEWMDLFEQFQQAGGQTGFRDQFSRGKGKETVIDRELGSIDRSNTKKWAYFVFDQLSAYNDALENSVRLAAFKAALDEGLTVERAASVAKNITVNFNRKGSSTQSIGALYAFFNASVQGTARIIETLFTKDKNGKMSLSSAGKKIIAGGMLLGVAQTALLALAGFGPDEPPEWVKSKNLIIPTFGAFGEGKYALIPMPLGYNVLPNIGRIASEYMMVQADEMKGKRDLKKTVTYIAEAILTSVNPLGSSTFAQTLAPTLVDPFIAVGENKDAFGRPISREDKALAPTPGYERSRESANGLSQAIAYGLNYITLGGDKGIGLVSPTADQISYIASQYAGGVGKLGIQAYEYAKSKVVGEEVQPYQVPIVGKLYGDINTPAAISGKFYENVIEMSKHENIIKNMKGKGVNEYYKENPEARLYQRANYIENEIARLKKEKRALMEKDAPAAQIKRKDDRIKEIMEAFNKDVTKRQ